MSSYRKRDVLVEAIEFHSGTRQNELAFAVANGMARYTRNGTLLLWTSDGPLEVVDGDWVICDSKGKYSACTPDAFRVEFEPA